MVTGELKNKIDALWHVNVNTHMYKKWNILMYNNGITHLLRESPEAHACL